MQYLSLHDEFRKRATAGLAELLQAVKDNAELQRLGDDLGSGKIKLEDVGVARFVHLLPEALQIKRPEVPEIIIDRVNAELDEPRLKQQAQITDMLWAQFENDAELLNNLALEYLAQHTNRLFDALSGVTFDDPVKEMEPRVGIGRTKSFGALSVALGASDSEVTVALEQVDVPTGAAADRAFVYLTALPHHRFVAVTCECLSRKS